MEKNVEVEKFVKAVLDGKNVKASKYLENILKQKCANKMMQTLNN